LRDHYQCNITAPQIEISGNEVKFADCYKEYDEEKKQCKICTTRVYTTKKSGANYAPHLKTYHPHLFNLIRINQSADRDVPTDLVGAVYDFSHHNNVLYDFQCKCAHCFPKTEKMKMSAF
jgi:hypothetical protein